jgi:hypothetical protein
MTEEVPKLDIEQLRKKHKELETKKIAAEANLHNAETQLHALKQQALERWGTDDLAELKQKLEDMKTDNEKKRAAYQDHIQGIENRLAEVEKQSVEARLGTK